MATVALVSRGAVSDRGPDAARAADAAVNILQIATVYCDANSVAMVGGTDTITINLATAIQNSRRNGKTVTVQSIAVTQCLTTQTSAGAEVSWCAYVTLSASVMTLIPKTDGYLTGSTSGTTAAVPAVRPYGILCAFTEA